jgi:hypothetical protein
MDILPNPGFLRVRVSDYQIAQAESAAKILSISVSSFGMRRRRGLASMSKAANGRLRHVRLIWAMLRVETQVK